MNQGELLQAVMRMQPGEALKLRRKDYLEAVAGELQGLDRLSPVRAEDVQAFFIKITANWDLELYCDVITRAVTLIKRSTGKEVKR